MVTWSNGYLEFLVLAAEPPLTKQELGGEGARIIKRTSKGMSRIKLKFIEQLQDKTTEYARKTRSSVDLDKIRELKKR